MELPKNIKQIGESNRYCKIYVEDYCVSYIKQMNQLALNKEMAVSLYGLRKSEGNVSYLFVYGAAKLDFLQREVRHLSQAQCQEIEKLRRKHFGEQEFLGYCLLNGEMVEGFFICEQEICRYVTGYAQFYEKNDSMLAYMLETRGTEADPEVVDSEKYDVVKRRQEERRAVQNQTAASQKTPVTVVPSRNFRSMRVATVAVFGLLCLIGLASLRDSEGTEELQVTARQVMSNLTEQKIPDAEDTTNQNSHTNTLIAEDKLTEALQQENAVGTSENILPENAETESGQTENAPTENNPAENNPTENGAAENTGTSEQTIIVEPLPKTGAEESAESQATAAQSQETTQTTTAATTQSAQENVAEPVSYTIKEGDTLIGIALRTYGSEKKVAEICSLNEITNPDDIKIGQKILLP